MALREGSVARWVIIAVAAVGLSACGTTYKHPAPMTRLPAGARPAVDVDGPKMQCVPFARQASGINIRGNAYTWWDQAQDKYHVDDEPEPGSVIVMRGRRPGEARGHVAVVRKVLNDREITVDHANWGNDELIHRDTPVLDVSEDNDWSRVRVWYIPGGHYGGTDYAVEGFILPKKRSSGGFLW